ncbi:MAG: S-adenosylmethionine-tRNA ribosyltransferase-isomerase, S-adenosylmethionine:tRNA ribosyltransferase-isomerase [Candidatus Peregrinibacteria bacterium GW2011_GWF2_43_17]|nr:MAG: S-adenosylmethionine-tRNA ribosyltransferase-isomerase, S-adenosylmethionine:tRNA ribosyltransferase-isomerase [Candidatus Peregrinibacteria bacterium GW2011_GWF2_43_17]KKT20001.1 MAG: S-adenosylmethionine:tRNA ribosyltransferase-isomerase [Candidatus Peregrinibacteria bacterium GW2011_GWA2_43_8]HAU39632.1 tRNA preQ1(34) S-adenosylmethionine ribosyltransferase-isomerase QueA [Candidatus Peregrinibacteria bacterium]
MKISEFDYNLPNSLIATEPKNPRHLSNLMVIDRKSKKITHKKFFDLPKILNKNCVLVFNDSKVIKARLFGKIPAKIEILLTKKLDKNLWECLCKPGKKLKIGTNIRFNKDLSGKVTKINKDGSRIIKFSSKKDFKKIIEKLGHTPLPPYIKGSKAKSSQYQTIYAKEDGSVAAPTAGLHFTKKVFSDLEKKGIATYFVTLHVGRGTFEPVKVDDIKDHKMHSEWFTIDNKTATALNNAKTSGKKILAVGTTTVRVLESCAKNGKLTSTSGETNIFIYPGYKWQFVDKMLTNFHLPKSTLLMLVSSFAGKTLIQKAYKTAIMKKYRFYSFGDVTLMV